MNAAPKRFSLKRLLAAALLVLLAAGMALIYVCFGAKPVAGSKSITITVVNAAAQEKTFPLRTDASYLLQAMDECEGLAYSGTESAYGLMITEINGERAVYEENGAYWGFFVNGDYCNYGVSEQPVHDGDAFVIAYTK